MKCRIPIFAEFGSEDSKKALEYTKDIISGMNGIEFEEKYIRRKSTYGSVVTFSILVEEDLTRDEAEDIVDDIHYNMLGGCGYENMEMTDKGIERVE